jgi:long-chain acyl-CoA synthetase
LKGPGVFLGYYKDVAKTKETIDENGWLHTGDIGTVIPGSGALKIIDRKKNIFKLQQGEYVAAEKVEAIYMKDNRIEEVFLHGESTQSYCVAVIVPSQAYIKELVGGTENASEKINEKPIREKLLTDLNNMSKKAGLMGF